MKRRRILTAAIFTTTILLTAVYHAGAASFSITSGTNNTARTLNEGETGSVSAGANLSISGSTVAITLGVTSGTTIITNSGNILQTGTGRTIRNSSSGTPSISITNNSGALIRSADADTIRADVAGSNWTINNTGTISSLNPSLGGNQAIDFDAVTTGTVSITNNAGGQILAFAADAIRPGANASIINAGTITTTLNSLDTAPSSDGIDTQKRAGVTVTNSGSISGRHAITGGDAALSTYSIIVHNNAGGIITGSNGSGVNIDGVFVSATANVTNAFGATIQGSVGATFANGDGDGVDVDGVLTLNNSGNIFGYGAKGVGSDTLNNHAEAVAIGGGSITNTATGQIIGSTLAADAPNGDTSRAGNGILIDNSSGGNAVAATTVANSGLIRGKTGNAIKMIGTFANTITNNATGTIRGAGTGAAIQTGNGNDAINNAGTITGDNGLAIDMQGGNNTLNITGGVASITGNVSGGTGGTNTLTIDPGAGNSFSYSGAFSNFSGAEVKSGTVTLSGANTYTGKTSVTGGTLVNNGTLTGATEVFNAGAKAKGSGTYGSLSIYDRGTFAPGTSPGQTNVNGTLTYGADGVLEFEMNNATGAAGGPSGWDLAKVTGLLDITAGGTAGTRFEIDIISGDVNSPALAANFNNTQSYQWLIAQTTAGILGFDPTHFSLDSSLFLNSLGSGHLFLSADSNDLYLNFTPVPEPSTYGALVGVALLGLGVMGRRRRSARAS